MSLQTLDDLSEARVLALVLCLLPFVSELSCVLIVEVPEVEAHSISLQASLKSLSVIVFCFDKCQLLSWPKSKIDGRSDDIRPQVKVHLEQADHSV